MPRATEFEKTVAKMVLMVVLAFAVSWTPYFLVSLVTQYTSNFMERENFFFTMLCINLFAFLNSCVNPFIYAAMSTRFRNGFRRCFRFVCLMGLFAAPADEGGVSPSIAERRRRHKVVTFRCQVPKACMNTQSSSDGNSQSDTRQHSTITASVEDNGKRYGGSFFKSFAKRQRFFVNSRKKLPTTWPNSHQTPIALTEDIPMATKLVFTKLDKKSRSSTGDVSLLAETRVDVTPPMSAKRYNSCLNINRFSD